MNVEVNDSAHWREFENTAVTHSAAHYLMAIDSLRQELGYARVTDVAEKLSVSRGAASMSVAQLKKRGLVEEDPNRFLLLTAEGQKVTDLVEGNFRILSVFFEEILGVPKDAAAADACKMEHLMSTQTGKRLLALMRYLLEDRRRTDRVRKAVEEFEDSCSGHASEDCPVCQELGFCLCIQDDSAKATTKTTP